MRLRVNQGETPSVCSVGMIAVGGSDCKRVFRLSRRDKSGLRLIVAHILAGVFGGAVLTVARRKGCGPQEGSGGPQFGWLSRRPPGADGRTQSCAVFFSVANLAGRPGPGGFALLSSALRRR